MTDKEIIYETLDYRAEKITELESEIERLKEQLEEYPFKCKVGNNSEIHSKSIQDYDRLIDDIQAEAVKEFAERLKAKAQPDLPWLWWVDIEDIDNLVKEMVGEG